MKKRIVVLIMLLSLLYACKSDDMDVAPETITIPDPEPVEKTWSKVIVSGSHFSSRKDHEIISFNNKLWVFTGELESTGNNIDDAWSSSDGIHWVKVNPDPPFKSTERIYDLVVFKNKLWYLGDGDDTWSSIEGTNWLQTSVLSNFPNLRNYQTIEFNNKLWVIGGILGKNMTNDIWSSIDGINWIAETSSTIFPNRYGHQVVVFNNKLWLIGGRSFKLINDGLPNEELVIEFYNDVWSSIDGANWVEETNSANFSPVFGHKSIVLDNKLWVMGGYNKEGDFQNDMWTSVDGINWNKEMAALPFINPSIDPLSNIYADYYFMPYLFEVFNDKLWLIGKSSDSQDIYSNDIWVLE